MAEVIWTAEEVGRLIDAVKRRDSLYNPASGEYRNRLALNQCWKEVAEVVGGGKTEVQCHDKWNILRSVYRRQRRNMEADSSNATKRTKWRWTDRMSFLHEYFTTPMKPFPTHRFPSPSEARSPAATPSAAATPSSPADVETEGVPSPAPPALVPIAARVSVKAPAAEQPWVGGGGGVEGGWPGGRPGRRAVRHHHRRQERRVPALSEELREWLRVKRSAEEVDPFFLSVTKDMRKLSDKDQSMFKIQVQTLLHEFLYPSE